MNTTLKRVISLMLCFVLMAGILPVGAMAAEGEETVATESTEATQDATEPAASEETSEPEGDTAPSEEVTEPAGEEIASYGLTRAADYLDAAIFCSDVHGNPSTVTSIFNGIKSADSAFNPSTASFVGDTQCAASSVTSAAQQVYSSVQCIYAFGNHDDEGNYGIDDFTGLSYGSSSTNYYIYTISENDMSTSNPDTSGFTSTVAGLDKTKPLFIISHMPLHARRGDNNGAAAWYTAISAAAKSMDIFFFWAHNHTSEGSADTAAYYVAKNGSETISIQGGSTVTPNFTYANAGYIDPPNTPARNNVATAVRIYTDSVNLTVYNASGELSGTYAVNETVTREFASSTDSGDSGDSTDPTEETTAPTDPTEGEGEGGTTTETKEVYVLVDSLTNNGEYLIVNTNAAGTGYAMNHSSGTEGAAAVTIQESGDYIYIDLDDSTAVWTATTSSSGFTLMNGSYYLEAYGSTSAIEISTTQAYSARYWTYSDSALGYIGGTSDHYIYYDSGFVSAKNSGSEAVYIYEKQTITVSSDGTVSGGGSTEGGSGEDDTTTGGTTETVVGTGTYTTADDGSYQKVTFGTEGEKKTVYVLVSTPTAGKNYIIASDNSAGTVYALKENTTTGTSVTVNAATDSITAPFIENSDNAIVWTASSGMNFKSVNGGYYLNYSESKGSYSLSFSTSSASDWTVGTNVMYREGTNNDYYLRYNRGWTMGGKGTEYNVYFYEEQTIDTSSSVTYSVTASDIEHFYTADTTDTETATITKSVTEGAPGGTYTYEIVEGGDDIITSISDDGIITFNGTEGTAQVKVSYTWTDGDNTYTIWQVIDVTATSPYYTLDLHKAVYTFTEVSITEFESDKTYYVKNADGTYSVASEYVEGTTYYTASATLGDEITETVAIKGVEKGDTYSVWAVIKYYDGIIEDGEDGKDEGDVDDQLIEWTSSDETIATVDPTTGIITFTGKDGTVNITATYLNGNKPTDTITISATASQYSVPADGTSDFPEYPNEGAIRFDKTATAVGNFSETGIAQVELSMTGVPYTSGSEIDVVIMLDITGSMHDVTTSTYTYSQYTRVEATIIATMEFVKSIVVNEDGTYNNNRVGVYSFNSGGTYTLWELGKVTDLDTINAAIQKFDDNYKTGGTPYDDGLSKVQSVLTAAKTDGTGNNRQQFAVFMTDGVPTDYEYITGTTHANYSSASNIAGMLTSSDNYATRDTDYYYEYYSTEMKKAGVTVYSVGIGLENTNSAWSGTAAQCLNLASRLLNDISGPAGETTQPDAVGTSTLSKQDSYFFSVDDANAATDMKNVFSNIAVKILQAATNVTVEDKITDEYTMIFDIPTGDKTITGVTNDFYIEFLKYTLDENHERTDEVTSVTKLYLKNTDGVYSAAKDSSGTAYDAPVFAQSTIGEKGTLYYWTTDQTMASKAAVSYSDGTNTYYFIPYGMEANADGSAPTGWYNMTSGGYANGTVDAETNMSENLVIATPYFVYDAGTKMLYWTVDKLDTSEYALRYFLYLDRSATEIGTDNEIPADAYPTNDHAYITYTNFNGTECQQKFPVPQLTWNGAQVSYVFYLVNAAGQPINKSGQVVDFANATFVTDVFTHTVVWNGDNAVEELNIDYLADELLPDDYKVYDENAKYTIHVYQTADGETVFDYFIIEGSEKDTENAENGNTVASVETTKVYNTKAGTKYDDYGVYSASAVGSTFTATDADGNKVTIKTTIQASLDYSDTTVAFAVLWEPNLVEDVVVVDFGLDVLIDVVANDNLQNTVSGIGLGKEAYGSVDMNTGVSTTSELGIAALTIEGNTISIESENQIRFHQGDMLFAEPVVFYYESPVKFYEGSEQKTGYMYSSVTVIPATTVYYEDSFVDLEVYTDADDKLFWKDSEGNSDTDRREWEVVGTTINATQAQDRPGQSQISATLDADNNYGYDGAYANLSTYSMGSARKLTVDSTYFGKVKFSFCGTGFDVISMTSNDTGTIVVQVFDASGTSVRSIMVDTYYGYVLKDDEWVLSNNDPNALYQVPVITVEGLDYGTYSVVITAAYNEFLDHVEDGSYDLYLDAIRIYDPTGNLNETAKNAYVADGEGRPSYTELRDNIIEGTKFKVDVNEDGSYTVTTVEGDTELGGAIFIDSNDDATLIADYVSYGPNNELYLDNGQAVAFNVETTNVADVQLGIKSATGAEVIYKINGVSYTVNTAADMYYSILKQAKAGTVIIENVSGGILSLTTIKVTHPSDPGNANAANVLSIDEESAGFALMSLRRAPVVEPEVTEPTVPETETTAPETEGTQPETETTAPETEGTQPETETTAPETEGTQPETETTAPETEETQPETETNVPETEGTQPETEPTEPGEDSGAGNTIVEVIGKIIRRLFGWLFG